MTTSDIARAVTTALARLAPDADVERVDPDADLRDALDLDSMDFLNLVVALNETLGVAVPEADYGKVRTMRGLVAYLEELAGRTA
jgi:acyl carrier protein